MLGGAATNRLLKAACSRRNPKVRAGLVLGVGSLFNCSAAVSNFRRNAPRSADDLNFRLKFSSFTSRFESSATNLIFREIRFFCVLAEPEATKKEEPGQSSQLFGAHRRHTGLAKDSSDRRERRRLKRSGEQTALQATNRQFHWPARGCRHNRSIRIPMTAGGKVSRRNRVIWSSSLQPTGDCFEKGVSIHPLQTSYRFQTAKGGALCSILRIKSLKGG
jgi:hypothetical protein